MPKNFVQYNRYERGINTRVDDTDIDTASLAECNGWNINAPGEIFTQEAGQDVNDLEFDVDDGTPISPAISGHSEIVVRSDYTYASPAVPVSGGNTMMFFADTDGDVGLLTDIEGTPAYTNDVMTSTSAAAVSPSFFWFEGVLRMSNPEHDTTMKPQWFGLINRTRFEGTTDTANVVNNVWTQEDSALVAPPVANQTNNGNGVVYVNVSASKVPDTSAAMPNVILQQTEDDENGQWSATPYVFGMSYVYEGNQESTITDMIIEDENSATQSDYSINLRQYFTGVKIFVKTVPGTTDFPLRQTGCRVYIKKANGGSRWRLFLDADFRRGIRTNTFDRFSNAWSRTDTGEYTVTSAIDMISPSIETYEGLTGVVNDEVAVSFQNDGHGWGDAEAAGRRVFYSGCKYFLGDGGAVDAVQHDRIFYSMGGKPDVVPPTNWIDLGINDGDEFIALKSFAGRLLAFKRNKIYVINVAHGSPMGWAVEQEIDNNGVLTQSAVIKTRYGIVWANPYGCFLYAGKQPQELSGTIGSAEWREFLPRDTYLLGFDTKVNVLHIVTADPSATSIALTTGWSYNFELQGWSRKSFDSRRRRNGYYNKQDGSLCYMVHDDESANKYRSFKVKSVMSSTQYLTNTFRLKDDTLKSPGVKKRFYRVFISMKNEASAAISLYMNGVSAESKAITNANTEFVTKIFTPSSPIESESMQLEVRSSGTGGIAINNILLEYRIKRLKQSEEGNA